MAQQTQTKKLKKICEIAKGKKVKIMDKKTKNSIPYLLIDTLRGEEPKFFTEDKKYTEAQENDILMVFDGANSGLVGTGLKGAVGSTIGRIRLKESVDSKYLSHFLSFNFSDLNRDIKGSAIPHVKPKKLLAMEIRLPPKQEQKLIAQEIEKQFTRLDETIKNLKSIKEKLEVYKKIVLKAAFKDKPTKELQSFCQNVKSDIVDGPFGSNMKRSDYISEGIPVLKIQNIKPFNIILKKMDYVSKEKYNDLIRHSFRPRDIILTKLGEPLGISTIIPRGLKGIIVADLVRIRVRGIDLNYLCYVLNSPVISNFINSKQKGTTRPRVKLSIVRELPIPYVGLEEQKQIVQQIELKFSIIDKLETTVNKSLLKTEQLRKSILKMAFEGKLAK